jgi:DNA-binding winged helix-turn-helix (wHTH) protein/tetratricopeptide (TPR) repeat protein
VDQPADIHFDDWTFRSHPRELLRQGRRVRLQDQPLHVLEELLLRPGELVTREHLIGRLWPKRIVEFDAALNAAVRRLRAALGDEAETPRYIETVPRQGYRFIGTLQDLDVGARGEIGGRFETGVHAAAERPMPAAELTHTQSGNRKPHQLRAILIALAAAIFMGGIAVLGSRGSPDPAAGDAETLHAAEPLQRARFFAQRRAPGDLARARQQYEQALSIDSSLARAWAGLASVHWLEAAEGVQPREVNLPKVRDAAQRALTLDPQLAEAHLRMALYLVATGQYEAALAHKKKAAELEPNNPLMLGLLASHAAGDGRWDEAIILQRRATAADPLSPTTAANLAYFYFLSGRIEEAKAQVAKVLELDPNFPDEIFAFVHILEGRHDEALHKVEAWREGVPRDHALALVYHGLGRHAEADETLRTLIAKVGKTDPIRVAEVYAFRGETEEAFRWLQATDALVPPKADRLMLASPFFRGLHGDERWRRMMESSH